MTYGHLVSFHSLSMIRGSSQTIRGLEEIMSRSDPSTLYLSCLASGKWQVVRPRPVAYPERRITSPDSLQLPPKQYLSLCKEDRSHRMFPQPATMVETARNRSDLLNNLLALSYTRSFERDVFPRISYDHESRIHT